MLLGIMSTDSGDGMEWIEEGLWEGFGRSCKYLDLYFHTVLLWKVTIRFSETSPIVTVFSRQKEREKKQTPLWNGVFAQMYLGIPELVESVNKHCFHGEQCHIYIIKELVCPFLRYKAGIP